MNSDTYYNFDSFGMGGPAPPSSPSMQQHEYVDTQHYPQEESTPSSSWSYHSEHSQRISRFDPVLPSGSEESYPYESHSSLFYPPPNQPTGPTMNYSQPEHLDSLQLGSNIDDNGNFGLSEYSFDSQPSIQYPGPQIGQVPILRLVTEVEQQVAVTGTPIRRADRMSASPRTPLHLSPASAESSSSGHHSPFTPPNLFGRSLDPHVSRSPASPHSPYIGADFSKLSVQSPSPSYAASIALPASPIVQRNRTSSIASSIIPMQPERGPLVPQKRYKPNTSSDRRRYVEEIDLQLPILFCLRNPTENGISLESAMRINFSRLIDREDLMFQDCGPSISIRINWPGYTPWSRQIPTRDFKTPPGPITRAKLARNVAKTVRRFIDEHANKEMEEEGDEHWKVDNKGGSQRIQWKDLALLQLDHVSKGSWQVQLQLLRPQDGFPARR